MDLQSRIYDVVRRIPKGKVMTYGDVALAVGQGGPRYVGYVLHHNPDENTIPCHRVVNAQGRVAKTFAFGGEDGQVKKLQAEGIQFVNGKIPLARYRYRSA